MTDKQQWIAFQIALNEQRIVDEAAAFRQRQFDLKKTVSDLKAQLADQLSEIPDARCP